MRRAHRLAVGDGILEALEDGAERARRAGRYEQARRFVLRVLDFDAGRRSARRMLGLIELDRGHCHDAFECFRALCEEDPGDAWSACRAGEALFDAGDYRAARKWLRFAVDIGPDQDPRSHRRARILLQRVRRRCRSR